MAIKKIKLKKFNKVIVQNEIKTTNFRNTQRKLLQCSEKEK